MCRAVGRLRTGEESCWRTTTGECEREGLRREAAALPLSLDAQEALRLFHASQTQWRIGFSGATGLDYVALEIVGRAIGVPLEPVLPLVQVLESEQLALWAPPPEEKSE